MKFARNKMAETGESLKSNAFTGINGMETQQYNGHLPATAQVTELQPQQQHNVTPTVSGTTAMATMESNDDLDPSELKDKDTEKEHKADRSMDGSKTKEAKERENKKRERSPKSHEAGDKTSPQKATDPAKSKERDERIRQAKERREAEQRKKKDELHEQVKKKEDLLRKQEEDRKKKIRDMKRREEEHRLAIEDRRKRMLEEEVAKREALVKKYQSRDSRLEQMRNRRSMGSFAFGSSTPRMNFEGIDVSKRSASQSCLLNSSSRVSSAHAHAPDDPGAMAGLDGGGHGTAASGLHASRRSASSLSLVRRNTDKPGVGAGSTLSTIPSSNRTGPGAAGLPARPASAAASYKRLSMSTSHLGNPNNNKKAGPATKTAPNARRSMVAGSVSNLHSHNNKSGAMTAGSKRAKSSYSDLTQSSEGSPIRRPPRPQSVGRLPNYASPTVSSKLRLGRTPRRQGDQTDGGGGATDTETLTVCYRFRSQSAPPVQKRAKSSDGRQNRNEVQATFNRLATPRTTTRDSSANQRTGSSTPPKPPVSKNATTKPKSLPTPPKAVVARSLTNLKDQKPPKTQSTKKETTPVKGPVKAIHKPSPSTQTEKRPARSTKPPVPIHTSQEKLSSKEKRSTASSRERTKAPAEKKTGPPPGGDRKEPPAPIRKPKSTATKDKATAEGKQQVRKDSKAETTEKKDTEKENQLKKVKSTEDLNQDVEEHESKTEEEVGEVVSEGVRPPSVEEERVVSPVDGASKAVTDEAQDNQKNQQEAVADTEVKEKVVEEKPEAVKEASKPRSSESTPSKKAEPNKAEATPTKMTPAEEAKVKLAEKRREARERAQREAEEKKRQEEEAKRLEEERIRREEEEQRRFEEEQLRLAEEARKAEEERLRLAIEEAEKIRAEEEARREQERVAKEEADRKAAEEAKRKQKEAEEKAKREEEERQERKKRLEMIMKRVKQDDTSPKSETPSPVRTPKAERSPSPPNVDVATELKARENAGEGETTEEMMTVTTSTTTTTTTTQVTNDPFIEATASPPPERVDFVTQDQTTAAVTPVKAFTTEEAAPKFKSPLLQQMLGKGRLKLSKENLAEKSSDSSNGENSSAKSSPDKEGEMAVTDEVTTETSQVTKTVTRTVTSFGEDGPETVVKTTETTEVSGDDLAGLNLNQLGNGSQLIGEDEGTLFKGTVIRDNSTMLMGDSKDSNQQTPEGDNDSSSGIANNGEADLIVGDNQGELRETVTDSAAATADLVDLGHLANGNGAGMESSGGLSESTSQELNGDVEMKENGQFSPVEQEDNRLDQLIDLNQVDNKMLEPGNEKLTDLLNSNVEHGQVPSKTPLIAFENNTTSNHATDNNSQDGSEPQVISFDQISQQPSHVDPREGALEANVNVQQDSCHTSLFHAVDQDESVSEETDDKANAFARNSSSEDVYGALKCAIQPLNEGDTIDTSFVKDMAIEHSEETVLEVENIPENVPHTKEDFKEHLTAEAVMDTEQAPDTVESLRCLSEDFQTGKDIDMHDSLTSGHVMEVAKDLNEAECDVTPPVVSKDFTEPDEFEPLPTARENRTETFIMSGDSFTETSVSKTEYDDADTIVISGTSMSESEKRSVDFVSDQDDQCLQKDDDDDILVDENFQDPEKGTDDIAESEAKHVPSELSVYEDPVDNSQDTSDSFTLPKEKEEMADGTEMLKTKETNHQSVESHAYSVAETEQPIVDVHEASNLQSMPDVPVDNFGYEDEQMEDTKDESVEDSNHQEEHLQFENVPTLESSAYPDKNITDGLKLEEKRLIESSKPDHFDTQDFEEAVGAESGISRDIVVSADELMAVNDYSDQSDSDAEDRMVNLNTEGGNQIDTTEYKGHTDIQNDGKGDIDDRKAENEMLTDTESDGNDWVVVNDMPNDSEDDPRNGMGDLDTAKDTDITDEKEVYTESYNETKGELNEVNSEGTDEEGDGAAETNSGNTDNMVLPTEVDRSGESNIGISNQSDGQFYVGGTDYQMADSSKAQLAENDHMADVDNDYIAEDNNLAQSDKDHMEDIDNDYMEENDQIADSKNYHMLDNDQIYDSDNDRLAKVDNDGLADNVQQKDSGNDQMVDVDNDGLADNKKQLVYSDSDQMTDNNDQMAVNGQLADVDNIQLADNDQMEDSNREEVVDINKMDYSDNDQKVDNERWVDSYNDKLVESESHYMSDTGRDEMVHKDNGDMADSDIELRATNEFNEAEMYDHKTDEFPVMADDTSVVFENNANVHQEPEVFSVPSDFQKPDDADILVADDGDNWSTTSQDTESFRDIIDCDKFQYETVGATQAVSNNEEETHSGDGPVIGFEKEDDANETGYLKDADSKKVYETYVTYTTEEYITETSETVITEKVTETVDVKHPEIQVEDPVDPVTEHVKYHKVNCDEEHIIEKLESEKELSIEQTVVESEMTPSEQVCSKDHQKRRHTSPVVILQDRDNNSGKINVGFMRYSLDHDTEMTHGGVFEDTSIQLDSKHAETEVPYSSSTHSEEIEIAEDENRQTETEGLDYYGDMKANDHGNECFSAAPTETTFPGDFPDEMENKDEAEKPFHSVVVSEEIKFHEAYNDDDDDDDDNRLTGEEFCDGGIKHDASEPRLGNSLNEVASSILEEVFNQVFVVCAESSRKPEEEEVGEDDEESQHSESDGSYIDLRAMKDSMDVRDRFHDDDDEEEEEESGMSDTDEDSEDEACLEMVQKLEVVMEETCDLTDMTELPSGEHTDSSSEVQTVGKDQSATVETTLTDSDSNSESGNEIKVALISSDESEVEEDLRRGEPQESNADVDDGSHLEIAKVYGLDASDTSPDKEDVQYSSPEECLRRESSSFSSSESEDSSSEMEYIPNDDGGEKVRQLSEVAEINEHLSPFSETGDQQNTGEFKQDTDNIVCESQTLDSQDVAAEDGDVVKEVREHSPNKNHNAESESHGELAAADFNENEPSDFVDTNDNQSDEILSTGIHTAINNRQMHTTMSQDNEVLEGRTTQLFGASLDVQVGSMGESTDEDEEVDNETDDVTGELDLTRFNVMVRKKGSDSFVEQDEQI